MKYSETLNNHIMTLLIASINYEKLKFFTIISTEILFNYGISEMTVEFDYCMSLRIGIERYSIFKHIKH